MKYYLSIPHSTLLIPNFLNFLIIIIVCSCKGNVKNTLLPTATGKPYEVFVVMDKKNPIKEELLSIFQEEVPCLPQSEPLMDAKYIDYKDFTNFVRYVRNVLYVEVDSSFRTASLSIKDNLWAKGQRVIYLHAPNPSVLKHFILSKENREHIINSFYSAELTREARNYLKEYNKEATQTLTDMFSIHLHVPNFLTQTKKGKDFFWAMSSSEPLIGLVVYSVPNNRENVFERDHLVFLRDSVMKENVQGGMEGSYMQTTPLSVRIKTLSINQQQTIEMRGLWEMKNDMMGGPFVSLSRVDTTTNCIVTTEVFVYAPSQKKRNLLKMGEAILNNLELEIRKEEF